MMGKQSMSVCVCLCAVMVAGCGDDDKPVVQFNNVGGNGPIGGVRPGPDMALDMLDMKADTGDMPSSNEFVPTSPDTLRRYLDDKLYEQLPFSNAEVLRSSGPHGFQRTFMNTLLAESLEEGATQHPAGAAAIKALYGQDKTTLKGWAVQVKVQDDSDAGRGWYWYEILDLRDGAAPVADGNDEPLCINCHVAGADFIRSPFPLE
jgi:hypothetical protein